MTPLVKLAILLVAALLVGRLSWRPRQAGLGVHLLFDLGTHFVLLGVLLGPVSGLLSRDVLDALAPFLVLGLGWTGMLIGAQLDRTQLRVFSRRLAVATLVQGVVAFAFAWGSAWLLIRTLGIEHPTWDPAGPAVLTLAAVTAVSAPAAVAMVSSSFRARGPVSQLLLFVASMDGLVGLVAVALIRAVHHPRVAALGFENWVGFWIVTWLLAGGMLGALFLSLTRSKPSPDELVLFLTGTVLFGSGISYALGLSPISVCLVAGAVVANFSGFRRRVYATLAAWEKPVYAVLLILAGAMLRPPDFSVVPLVIALLVVRVGAKLTGVWVALRVTGVGKGPRRLGLGLFANGGLAVAIAIGYAVTYAGTPDAGVDTLVTAVVVAVALSELAGPFLLKNVLRRSGELAAPVAPPAPALSG